MDSDVKNIRNLLENYNQPLLFKNWLHWELLSWDLDKWQQVLNETKLEFRIGKVAYTSEPQWERTTDTVKGQFKDLLGKAANNNNQWFYFDYKHLMKWFLDKEEFKKSITWKTFGFPEHGFKESTIWIGSEGAHTPCHIDAYGFNLVAQIYGRKRWILFPPEENLKKSRMPYEESSVYSKINFYSPDINICKGLSNCRSIILEPGNVLFIPNGWWHYVENLEIAISINCWMPHHNDDEKYIEEAIALVLIKTFTNSINETDAKEILNPNENLDDVTIYDTLKLLENQINKYKSKSTNKRLKADTSLSETSKYLPLENLLENYKNNLSVLPKLTNTEFLELMNVQASRFVKTDPTPPVISNLSTFVNAVVDQDVIELITKKLLNK